MLYLWLLLDLATVDDLAGLAWFARLATDALHLVEHFPAIDDPSENGVFSVQPVALRKGQEELAAVCVGSGVGHRQVASARVLDLEVLISEGAAVDRLAACARTMREVTSLGHETLDDSVKTASFKMEHFAAATPAFFTSAQAPEILSGDRRAISE